MGWFITQSLLFIIITAIIFFLIGLWVGWILWARRNKTTGKHTAETVERKSPASTSAKNSVEKAGATTSGTATTAADSHETTTPLAATAGETGSDGETRSDGEAGSTGEAEDTPDPAAAAGEADGSGGASTEPSDIEDENLAVYAGVEAQVVAEAEAATREAAVDEPEAGTQDDLTRIEGVGPKIAAALRAAGYGSYAKVAEASEDDLRQALAASGIKFAPAAMSFAAQAQYLVEGDEEGLEEYQDYLIAGRERRSADFVEEVDYTDVDEIEGRDAKEAALAADAAKAAEATGEDVDTEAVADDATTAGSDARTAGDDATPAGSDAGTAGDDATAARSDAGTAGDTAAAAGAAAAPDQPADDDLKVIEGIGPKIEKALKAAGITAYAQVAAASEAELRESIGKSGIKFAPSVKTWAQQAQYLVEGDGEGLDEYQDYLIGGQERGTTTFVEDVDYTDVDEVEGEAAKAAALAADAKKVAEAEGGKA
ncbi:helix-hairpin-helix domain-containing protein [Myceligenerans salitolerans]|uniref:Helix-hairpin-helix DNA-binding motif class 1 domain-containing protein n=1 Tax=Myceligenerans salitolerans TaxID=1230528 RepID=A0ABS3I512_9MICO|nr:helix-hairpin-helix domain-containing protein [Myceligenerans salitolerans]MBO0608060.1 hypothetical protein [Myceligenerans salitolerans]